MSSQSGRPAEGITAEQFRQVSDDRLTDCRALLAAGRYDAVMYLSGYVLEAALKACICDTLGWEGFPNRGGERAALFRPLFTHDLNMLLLYSGRESFVLSQLASEWNSVKGWKPELRYESSRSTTRAQAEQRIIEIERIQRAV